MNKTEIESYRTRLINLFKVLYEKDNIDAITKQQLEKVYNDLYQVESIINSEDELYSDKEKIDMMDEILHLEKNDKRLFIVDFNNISKEYNYPVLEDIKDGLTYYTEEEAKALLDWTVRNTQDNIKESGFGDDQDLTGVCGFAQFSSLYPLQTMDLKITINNANSFINKQNHAFGTVTIPVLKNDEIVDTTYLIDCSYSQFFLLNRCVKNRYLIGTTPGCGYFVKDNEYCINEVKELLENGYIEATEDNLKKIFYGIYLSSVPEEKVEEAKSEYQKINILETLFNKQELFDYEEEEFRVWGNNLEIENTLINHNKL